MTSALVSMLIRIQQFRSMRIWFWFRILGFDDQNFEKIYSKKISIFLSNIAIYLTLDLHKGRPSYRRSLQPARELPALQNMIFWIFFLFSWAILAFLHPEPDADPADKNQCGSIRTRIRSTSFLRMCRYTFTHCSARHN